MIKILNISLLFLVMLGSCSPGGTRPDDDFLNYDSEKYERISVNYQVYGRSDTTLLFIHGWNLDHTYWDYTVKHLKNRYKIVTLDLAGHGNSGRDRSSWTVESFAKDITGIINKEKLKYVILIGHSIGGEIALEVRNQLHDRIVGIIGVDNFKDVAFEITPAFQHDFKEYFNKFKRNYTEMADAYARKRIRSDNRDLINRIVEDYKSSDPKIALAIYKNMIPKYAEDKNSLQKLDFKLRIIGGDYSPFDEDALKTYTGAGYEIIQIKNAGHFPMVEQPEEFLLALEKMLGDLKKNVLILN